MKYVISYFGNDIYYLLENYYIRTNTFYIGFDENFKSLKEVYSYIDSHNLHKF